jgi:uncharacterized protein (DUF1501 family)
MQAHTLNRRRWLQIAGATLGGALGAGGLSSLVPGTARAQSSYKALVCIYLNGGNDGMNMVVPTDTTRYGQYAAVRAGLALPQGSLLGLGSSGYGLHPAMSALSSVWADGGLAPVFNVGPLYQPLTKAEFRAAPASSPLIPDSLFSHSDQQVLWESASTQAIARTGWGGRASATLGTANPVISVSGNSRFGASDLGAPLVLPGPGSTFGLQSLDGTWSPTVARKAALEALYAESQTNTLLANYALQQRNAMGVADRLGALVKTQPKDNTSPLIDTAFAPLINTTSGSVNTGIGQQLYQVAKLIEGHGTVQGMQQIFTTQLGGFDTHGNQISTDSQTGDHARLLKQLADAMACFYNAMAAIGMGNSVTLFTQSDFGRTFKPNSSSGTDHAWGNHQLVMGGDLNGLTTYGTYPELTLGGPDDVGASSWELHGRWIPTSSVDQYAATLLRWFGASEPQLDTILPNLRNFGSARHLGFLA